MQNMHVLCKMYARWGGNGVFAMWMAMGNGEGCVGESIDNLKLLKFLMVCE